MRQTFNINWGTVVTLGLPLVISGYVAFNNLADRVTVLDQRSKVSEQYQVETKAQLQLVADLPLRVKGLEEQQKAINDRLDRIAEAVIQGQRQFSKDLTDAIEPVRKDIAAVSTKVEVLADRVGARNNPERGVYRPR